MSLEDQGWIDPLASNDSRLFQQIGLLPPLPPSPGSCSSTDTLTQIGTGATSKKRKQAPSSPIGLLPPSTEMIAWPDLFRQHAILLENRESMSGRRFNKTALDLLNACVELAKKGVGPSVEGTFPSHEDQQWATQQEALSKFRTLLLNEKDVMGEDLVQQVVHYVHSTLSPLLTADEKREILMKKSLAFMHELSPALALKTGPIIKTIVAQLFDTRMDQMFAEISIPDMDVKEKSLLYRRMMANFIDNESCVSFMTTNRPLLGKLKAKDVWFLTFFACVTARRARGDQLLQLGCCGKSSVGKSILFESILLMTGHQILSSATSGSSDTGCGRWNVGTKNCIVFHDINIATLAGADLEKVKSIARCENSIAKIHSATVTISPVFLIYTSNERLFKHFIPAHLTGNGLAACHRSELDELTTSGKRKVSAENLEALRARFLEMYCFKTPKQDPQDLEKCGNFERSHFILGTYDRAMTLLEHYHPSDFRTPHLAAYILSALNKHLPFMEKVMCGMEHEDVSQCPLQHHQRLQELQKKYQTSL